MSITGTIVHRADIPRKILSVVAGIAAWLITAGSTGVILRGAWPEYASVADAMTFTLPMMLTRLAIGASATLAAGWVTALIARRSTAARLSTGLLLLAGFIPQHIMLWDKFPIWYHLTFLLSLVPLTYLGGTIVTSAVRSPLVAEAPRTS